MIARDFDPDDFGDDDETGTTTRDDDETDALPALRRGRLRRRRAVPELRPVPVAGGCPEPQALVGRPRGPDLPGDGGLVDLAPVTDRPTDPSASRPPLRVAWLFDMNACREPDGRHPPRARAARPAGPTARTSRLTVVSGRITEPDGLAYWERLDGLAPRSCPSRPATPSGSGGWPDGPPLEWRTGPVDWVYCPSELFVPTRKARLAVTSHDVLQDVRFGGPRRKALLAKVFDRADLVLSVSRFNTEKLLEFYPICRGKVAYVPNAAEELFFGEADPQRAGGVRADLGLPRGMPYLLSVANFQPRKNLPRWSAPRAGSARSPSGDLALVLLGAGAERRPGRSARRSTALGKKAVVKLPGYRQGRPSCAAYAEATALAFPSTCESFGIPAVEAMAQGIPVALADSTALPEIGGEAGWYFDPTDEDAIAATLRDLLDRPDERARKVEIGRALAEQYRWQAANDRLVDALKARPG